MTNSKYEVKSNGDVIITTTVPLEGLCGARRSQAIWNSVDSVLDCCTRIQEDIGLDPDIVDPRLNNKKS